MRIVSILTILFLLAPQAYAYPEYPPFHHTEFRDEYGMFRWWRGCWFRVLHAYAYITCDPSGGPIARVPLSAIPDLIEMGVLPADSETGELAERILARLRGENVRRGPRWSVGALRPADGDGYDLTDVFGGRFSRFDIPNLSGYGISRFDGVDFGRLPDFDGFDFDRFNPDFDGFDFNRSGRDFDGFEFSGRDRDSGSSRDRSSSSSRGTRDRSSSSSSRGGFTPSGADSEFGSLNGGTRMHDIFYRPRTSTGCQSIYDQRPGEIFGPTPCTSYPGVFGPTPRYGGTN